MSGYGLASIPAFYSQLFLGTQTTNLLKPPSVAACQKCHTNYRQVSPNGDLLIPHKAHVVVLKMNCVECHKNLVHSANEKGYNSPKMATCLAKCHDGKTASNKCTDCHTRKQTPESHAQKNWLEVHSEQAATGRLRQVPRVDPGLLRRLPQEPSGVPRRELEDRPRGGGQAARQGLPRLSRRREVLQEVPRLDAPTGSTVSWRMEVVSR